MKKRLSPFLALFLFLCVSCGKSDSPSPLLWSSEQIQRETQACVKGVTEGGSSPAQLRQGTLYCQCVYDAAARRWNYSDYQSRTAEYEAILDQDVSPQCEETARKAREVSALPIWKGNFQGPTLYDAVGVGRLSSQAEMLSALDDMRVVFEHQLGDQRPTLKAIRHLRALLGNPERRAIYDAFLKFTKERHLQRGSSNQQIEFFVEFFSQPNRPVQPRALGRFFLRFAATHPLKNYNRFPPPEPAVSTTEADTVTLPVLAKASTECGRSWGSLLRVAASVGGVGATLTLAQKAIAPTVEITEPSVLSAPAAVPVDVAPEVAVEKASTSRGRKFRARFE